MSKEAAGKYASPGRLIFRPDPKLLGSAEGNQREAKKGRQRLRAELKEIAGSNSSYPTSGNHHN
jgi:hypothetical protein